MVQEATAVLTGGISNTDSNIAFLFSIISKDRVEMSVDVTDHYVEDNTAIQDHAANAPIIFTLQGLIGEKVFENAQEVTDKISTQTSKLGPLGALLPIVSNYANVAISAASYLESSINRYYQIYENFKDKTERKNKQKETLKSLQGYRDSRTLMQLDGPYGHFENLLITYVDIQQNETTSQSELVVTLKEMRFAQTLTVAVDKNKYAQRVGQQAAQEQDLGKVQGKKEELTSTLYRMTH